MELLRFVVRNLETIILLICVIVYTSSYVKLESKALKFITYYLVVTFFVQLFSVFLSHFRENNLYLSHFYFIPQFLILSQFYKTLFNPFQKKIVNRVVFIVLSILVIQYIIEPGLFNKFNVLEIFITSFPIVVYSIMHLYNSLTKKGDFMYINAAILLYLSTSTLVFILGDYFSSFGRSDLVVNIWVFNKVLYIIFLLLILVEWKISIKQIKNK